MANAEVTVLLYIIETISLLLCRMGQISEVELSQNLHYATSCPLRVHNLLMKNEPSGAVWVIRAGTLSICSNKEEGHLPVAIWDSTKMSLTGCVSNGTLGCQSSALYRK